jgi:nucleoporin NUP2
MKTAGFTFGSGGSTPGSGPASTGTGSFFGFGAGSGSSGSIGNPVGFGFGTPATPKPLEAEGSGSGTLTEEENSQGSLGSEEDPAKFMMATNPHDEEGEGEEDEETLHHVRTKVFKLHKSTGTTKWVTAGLGKCLLVFPVPDRS